MSESKMSFENNMQRLEQIVRALERGDVPLDESLKLFQEGTDLVRSCQNMLDNAKQQVQKVLTDANGMPVMEEFTDAES